MPSRWTCAAILALWLLTNGWLLWKEVLPNLEPDQPPAISVDLIEEVQMDRHIEASWRVWANGKRAYHARTWVERGPGKDLFDLKMLVEPLPSDLAEITGVLKKMQSTSRVTAAGELRLITAYVEVARPVSSTFTLHGEVRGRRFHCGYKVLAPIPLAHEFPPIDVSHKGTVMLPLHPLQRIRELRPGQTWSVPTLDFGLVGVSVREVRARVLSEPETFEWCKKPTECLVIDSGSAEEQTRTWVERESGRVIKQESAFQGERWVMQREHRDR